MNNIAECYPIGTKIRLVDDYPGTVHEIYGYEWLGEKTNIMFVDGTKLSMDRLDLVADVEYPVEKYSVVVPCENSHADALGKFQKSEYKTVKLDFGTIEEAKKCQQAICMLLSRKKIFDIRATRNKNVLQLIREG